MSTTMQAAYFEEFGELDNIKIGTMDKPEAGEGEVLVRVKAAGVNPVDAAIATGQLKDAIPTNFPAIPGWDVAGVVEERGHSARRFEEGDEVYAYARQPEIEDGTFAEYISLSESYLAKRPENLSVEESAGIPLAGLTAYQSLFEAGNLQNDDTLLILGASGGVGTIAIQLAKAKGARVIGVAGSDNQEYMKEVGADETIDYKNQHVGKAVKELAPSGVDFVFHCSRGDSLDQVLEEETLKSGGTLISITNSNPEVDEDINFEYVFVEPNAVHLQHLQELADEGKLKIPVTNTFALDKSEDALKQISSLHTRGKIVITP